MIKKFFLICLFSLISCTPKYSNNNQIFSDNMSLNEFILNLNEYAKNSPYPNIND